MMARIASHEHKRVVRRACQRAHVICSVPGAIKQVEAPVLEEVDGAEAADGEAGLREVDLADGAALEGAVEQERGWVGWVAWHEVSTDPGADDQVGGGREDGGVADVVDVRVGPDDCVDGGEGEVVRGEGVGDVVHGVDAAVHAGEEGFNCG